MDPVATAAIAAVALAVGAVLGWTWGRESARRRAAERLAAEAVRLRSEAEQAAAATAETRLQQARAALAAESEAARAALERERQALARSEEAAAEREARAQRAEEKAAAREQSAAQRADTIDGKLAALDERDTRLRTAEERLAARAAECERREAAAQERERSVEARLGEVAGLSPEQARTQVLAAADTAMAEELAKRLAQHEKRVQERAKEAGIEIVARAVQRYAAEHTAESTITRVKIESEEHKGRVIGKEGRNIKAFEQATGVDVVIDEDQNSIGLSCFDPIRREVARRALETLLADGRIHPARIEEVLAKVRQDLDREVFRLGEDAAFKCEVSGLHPQLIKLLGKLQYRTSYGQNVLAHSVEASFLCGAMAADLGLDPRLGRRCGLLHDVGKAIDHEQEGSHPQLGYEALKRHGENEIVANAALAHHEGQQPLTVYTVLAAAADAISAARPGARHHSLENYIKRLAQLEEVACAFPGVQKAYAIQAGREVRVIVNQHTVPDALLAKIAHDIARAIEDQVQFPGEVKVTLIRETRQFAIAR